MKINVDSMHLHKIHWMDGEQRKCEMQVYAVNPSPSRMQVRCRSKGMEAAPLTFSHFPIIQLLVSWKVGIGAVQTAIVSFLVVVA